MSVIKEYGYIAVCDACYKRNFVVSSDEVMGVIGSHSVAEEWGGYTVEFYSCSVDSDHVSLAVQNATSALLTDESAGLQRGELVQRMDFFDVLSEKDDSFEYRFSMNHRSNPKSNTQLLEELRGLRDSDGLFPSIDRIKRTLHIGESRAKFLLSVARGYHPEFQ